MLLDRISVNGPTGQIEETLSRRRFAPDHPLVISAIYYEPFGFCSPIAGFEARHLSHNARSAFRFFYCCHPSLSRRRKPLGRSDSGGWHPFEIRNPHALIAFPLLVITVSKDLVVPFYVRTYPLFADAIRFIRNAMPLATAGCSCPFRLEPLPASHSPSGLSEFTIGCLACDRHPWIGFSFPPFCFTTPPSRLR
jgi:hypothetical protein